MAEQKKSTAKKTQIEFIKSPTGAFKLGYSAGDKVSVGKSKGQLSKQQAELLIEAGYAKWV